MSIILVHISVLKLQFGAIPVVVRETKPKKKKKSFYCTVFNSEPRMKQK